MSAIMHRRTVNVAISAEESGVEFGNSSSDVQASFLVGLDGCLELWSASQAWPIQCAKIAQDIPRERLGRIAQSLERLAEYLRFQDRIHRHVNKQDGTDDCMICGHDLRHELHERTSL